MKLTKQVDKGDLINDGLLVYCRGREIESL